MVTLDRTKDNPWVLKTPPGTAEYTMHVEDKDGRQVLVCTVGKTVLTYDARCIDDLYTMLKEAGDWVELGGADEQKPVKDGTVEAGKVAGKSSQWVVWIEKGFARPFWGLHPAADGSAGPVRA